MAGGLFEKVSFRWLLMGIIIVIILLITGVILNLNYQSSKNTLETHTDNLQENTEYSLLQSMILTDLGLRLFDQSLDYRLKREMDRFLTAYRESGGDPAAIDLESLKASFGEGYELYIINEMGVIEYTTYPSDHLLDFSVYPSFYNRLTSIREGNVFVSDRITTEINTGQVRKFVYHPTPDNRYILEISYIDDEIKMMRSALLYTQATVKVRDMNPYLTSIRIFNFLGDEVGNSSYVPEEFRTEIIQSVLETGEGYVIEDPDRATFTRYLFIDLTGNDNPPEMNLVAELTYTTAPVQEKLNSLFMSHLIIAGFALVVGGGVAFTTTRFITRPIDHLVEDTLAIRGGNLDHPIRQSQLPEVRSLSLSMSEMVNSLKDMMERLQASEEELRQHNDELEVKVEERTAALRDAHDEVNFYLDIITHDINNTNHTAQLYLELLSEESDPTLASFIEKVKLSLRKSNEIIGNVSTLRKIQEMENELTAVSLRSVLAGEAERDDRITLTMKDDILVLADPLISQAFTNIVDNSLKFGGDDVSVSIDVSEDDDEAVIRFSDTGPGIPDSIKPHIFARYQRGTTERVRGKGLGLFIVQTLIHDRYGGSIQVIDRLPGDHTKGVSFIIRLKKASNGL
ncbi:sensor histidine kinase [Methanocalculus chunghsingensis]|uniref:sensor histidine kinase n=1 Tax=Methanocalculus chunghsingensis TaxID=156457 RepID=UPI001B8C0487